MEIANFCFTAEDIDGHSCIQFLKKGEAVKLINHSSVKIKNGANLSNLKRSDIAMIKK